MHGILRHSLGEPLGGQADRARAGESVSEGGDGEGEDVQEGHEQEEGDGPGPRRGPSRPRRACTEPVGDRKGL